MQHVILISRAGVEMYVVPYTNANMALLDKLIGTDDQPIRVVQWNSADCINQMKQLHEIDGISRLDTEHMGKIIVEHVYFIHYCSCC